MFQKGLLPEKRMHWNLPPADSFQGTAELPFKVFGNHDYRVRAINRGYQGSTGRQQSPRGALFFKFKKFGLTCTTNTVLLADQQRS